MATALALAARGRGRTSPNPMVGAVIVDDAGVVVGTGFHERAGEAHAEVHALRAAAARARGATLYCTLEPCSHTGRTGPVRGRRGRGRHPPRRRRDAGSVSRGRRPRPGLPARSRRRGRGRRARGRGAAAQRSVRDQRPGAAAVRHREDRDEPRWRGRRGAGRPDGGERRGVAAARAARARRGRGHRHRLGHAGGRRSRADRAGRVAGAAADPRRLRSPAAHVARGPPVRHDRPRSDPGRHDPRRGDRARRSGPRAGRPRRDDPRPRRRLAGAGGRGPARARRHLAACSRADRRCTPRRGRPASSIASAAMCHRWRWGRLVSPGPCRRPSGSSPWAPPAPSRSATTF